MSAIENRHIDCGRPQCAQDEAPALSGGGAQRLAGDDDAVAAVTLGLVERRVGRPDQARDVAFPALGRREADADGEQGSSAVRFHGLRRHGGAKRFGESDRFVARSAEHQHDELVAAVPAERKAAVARGAAQHVGEAPQSGVAEFVAEAVVHRLELVEIADQRGDGGAARRGRGRQTRRRLFETAAIEQAG